MKAAIQTIIDNNNYGNRLQNYALQELLRKNDIEVVTIKNNITNTFVKHSVNNMEGLMQTFIGGKIQRRIKRKLYEIKNKEINNQRRKKFLNFTEKNIIEMEKVYLNIPKDDSDFEDIDFFVIGSDQVWNYSFPINYLKL